MSASVIIPALNEEATIGQTVGSVLDGSRSPVEVIVVDNGSTDGTARLAEQAGARVIEVAGGTIAGVRNAGVTESQGDCLVFLDADVRVLPGWHDRFEQVCVELRESPMRVTGARLQTTGEGGFIERNWFQHLSGTRAAYINSGHLITSRVLFDRVSGFDARLRTAEDHDFCVRAKRAGADVIEDPALVAVHDGYPSTWWGFIRREAWHGGQDVSSWSLLVDSKMAWIAVANALCFTTAIVLAVLVSPLALPAYGVGLYVIALLLATLKFPKLRASQRLATAVVFMAYIWGRSLSILPAFRRRAS